MTRDEIMAMKPGRGLDALVAEKVMGLEKHTAAYPEDYDERVLWFGDPPRVKAYYVPFYSTDITAAWVAWEHDRQKDWIMTINWTDGQYTAKIMTVNEDVLKYVAKIEADTAAEAMVKCRLLAVGVSGE